MISHDFQTRYNVDPSASLLQTDGQSKEQTIPLNSAEFSLAKTSLSFGSGQSYLRIFRKHFIDLITKGYSKDLGLEQRLDACDALMSFIPDPDRVRADNAESFRNGGPGIWAHVVQNVVWPSVPFTVPEIASMAPCDPSRLRKSYPIRSNSEYLHTNILLAMLHHTSFPTERWPQLPTEKQWAIAGIGKIAPRIFDVVWQRMRFKDSRLEVREVTSIPFKVGVVLDCLVSNPMLHVIKRLDEIQPEAGVLRNDSMVMRLLEDCVEQGNTILSEYPLLVETVKPISLEAELREIGRSLLYIESWFLSRELFFESLNDCEHLLGIFA